MFSALQKAPDRPGLKMRSIQRRFILTGFHRLPSGAYGLWHGGWPIPCGH